jgi:SAM-dependent methyltransferase
MITLRKRVLDALYPDPTLPYRRALLSAAGPGTLALEIGAGSGVGKGKQGHSPLRGVVGYLVGIDLEPAVGTNPTLDVGFVADASRLPFPDESFNLVFHRMVAEHFEEPAGPIRECARVLRPGGKLVFITPNRWHYAMVVAALTPTWFHRFWIGRVLHFRAEHQIFPTFYRANTRRTIARLLRDAGLSGRISMLRTRPGYLSFFLPLMLLGIAWEQVIERSIPVLRGRILVEATRPNRRIARGQPDGTAFERAGRGASAPSR